MPILSKTFLDETRRIANLVKISFVILMMFEYICIMYIAQKYKQVRNMKPSWDIY